MQSFALQLRHEDTEKSEKDALLKTGDVWKCNALHYRLALWGLWWMLETGAAFSSWGHECQCF